MKNRQTHGCKQPAKMLFLFGPVLFSELLLLTQTDLSLDLEGYNFFSPPFPPVCVLFISPMKIKLGSSCTGGVGCEGDGGIYF